VKLPQTIVPAEVNNSTYRYRDAVEMMDDMRRLRRTTGWTASWVRTDEKLFIFHLVDFNSENPDLEFFAQFEIKIKDVYRDFWPGKYPGDPTVGKFRTAFFTKGGPSIIAQAINEVSLEEQLPEAASAWSRLLRDDDEW
jgi:hypothetical protein